MRSFDGSRPSGSTSQEGCLSSARAWLKARTLDIRRRTSCSIRRPSQDSRRNPISCAVTHQQPSTGATIRCIRTQAAGTASRSPTSATRIIRRRDKVVAYWISQTNPLDGFEVHGSGTEAQLAFDNRAEHVGAALPGATYRAQWAAFDNQRGIEQPFGAEIVLGERQLAIPDGAWGPRDEAGFRYATAAIRSVHPDFPHWADPVRVTVRNKNGSLDVVGIERPAASAEGTRE